MRRRRQSIAGATETDIRSKLQAENHFYYI